MLKYLKIALLVLITLTVGSLNADIKEYYTGTIYYGKTNPVGSISFYLEYNATDTALKVTYEVDAPWLLASCHLNLWPFTPTQRGSPGRYSYTSGYLDINANTYTFTIPIPSLIPAAYHGNDILYEAWTIYFCCDVYPVAHCEIYNDADGNGRYDCGEEVETGFGCDHLVDPNPQGQSAWFRYCYFHLTRPEDGQTWTTFTPGYWKNHPEAFAGYLPITLAGVTVSTVNQALSILSNPAARVAWNSFLCHFLCLEFNKCYDPTLINAYYNDPNATGEFMENQTVGYINAIANTYRATTPRSTLLAMKDVIDAINNNVQYRVLWGGSQGSIVSLPNTVNFALKPNPFTNTTEIRFANKLNGTVKIGIYDLTGKKVRDLSADNSIIWDGTDNNGKKLSRGVYIVRLENTPERPTVKALICR